jgi:hypothetical protein
MSVVWLTEVWSLVVRLSSCLAKPYSCPTFSIHGCLSHRLAPPADYLLLGCTTRRSPSVEVAQRSATTLQPCRAVQDTGHPATSPSSNLLSTRQTALTIASTPFLLILTFPCVPIPGHIPGREHWRGGWGVACRGTVIGWCVHRH